MRPSGVLASRAWGATTVSVTCDDRIVGYALFFVVWVVCLCSMCRAFDNSFASKDDTILPFS